MIIEDVPPDYAIPPWSAKKLIARNVGRTKTHIRKATNSVGSTESYCGITTPWPRKALTYGEWRDNRPLHPAIRLCARCEASAERAAAKAPQYKPEVCERI